MASSLLTLTSWFSTGSYPQPTKPILSLRPISCTLLSTAHRHEPVVSCDVITPIASTALARRSGNYKPCIWDDNYLHSLSNPYTGEMYSEKAKKLMGIVRTMLNKANEPFDQRLELIDSLQRLGLAHHFKTEIKEVLEHAYNNLNNDIGDEDCTLHSTALKFRLLRDHGYSVSSDTFCGFKASLCNDVKGMLSLYEASFYGMEGEDILDEALELCTKYLKEADVDDPKLAMQVKHALEVPLRWSSERLEARWFIEAYERAGNTNSILLELAKLDYNLVQALYQEEVKDVSRWWRNSHLGERLSFPRNRVVASYLWGIGIASEPRFASCRTMIGKTVTLIGVMDDMYDVYGTLEELQLFTDAVERWDVNEMNHLPDYMKIAYLALYNWVHEMAYDVLMEQSAVVVQHLKNAWLGLFRAYLLEAKWYHSGHAPTMEEYINNAWISVTAPMIAVLCYLVVTKPIVEKELEFLEGHPDILRLTSLIIRLEDDLGTSSDEMKRGDVPKAIQCYMRETGASEEAAREHVRQLVREAWKKVNKYQAEDVSLPKTCVQFMLDFARIARYFYWHGDGHGVQDHTKGLASSLLFEPIPLK